MSSESRVYFIRPVGMDGPIKIGCSKKPPKRLLVLAAWSPFPLEIIGSVAGSFAEEALLQSRFSDLHTRKEWFLSSPTLRQTIELILSGTPIKEACADLTAKRSIKGQKRPIRTPERELFLEYGRRVRKASDSVYRSGEKVKHYRPPDIRLIMENWRCDRVVGHLPIVPTPEQFARLDEFIADPKPHCVSFTEAFPKLVSSANQHPHHKPCSDTGHNDEPDHVGIALKHEPSRRMA